MGRRIILERRLVIMSKDLFNFDFQNPNPSIQEEFAKINKEAQQFYERCCLEKKDSLLALATKEERLRWCYKAIINGAANYIVVSHWFLEKEIEASEEKIFILNISHSALTAEYLIPLLGLMAEAKAIKRNEAEIDLLKRIMEL